MGGNQTSSTGPPKWAQPVFQQYLASLEANAFPGGNWVTDKEGHRWYEPPNPAQFAQNPYAPGHVAPFSDLQNEAFAKIHQLGADSPIAGAAGQQGIDTLSGKYLDQINQQYAKPNPELDAYYNAAASGLTNQYQQSTAPGITAQAVREGALGSSGQNQAEQYAKWGLGQNLGNLAANIYEPAYEAERGRQVQQYEGERNRQLGAVGQVPSLISSQFLAPQAMLTAGGLQQAQGQNELNVAQQNQTQQGLWPYQAAQLFANGLGAIFGGQQVTSGGGSMK